MTDKIAAFQAIEARALDRYNAAVAQTNAIAWGGRGEALACLDEDACRVAWLRARRARIDTVSALSKALPEQGEGCNALRSGGEG